MTEHPVQNADDFKTLQYIFENMTVSENLKSFEEDRLHYGDDALMLPYFAIGNKTAFQTMVEHWVGTENLVYALYDEPEVNHWGDLIHRAGKLLVHHACGHIRDLLPLMAGMEIDAIESITSPPTGNVTLQEASAVLPEKIALVGGIDPVLLLNGSIEQVCLEAARLIHDLAGRRFVLANSDSCPPGVAYEKFLAISEIVAKLPGLQ